MTTPSTHQSYFRGDQQCYLHTQWWSTTTLRLVECFGRCICVSRLNFPLSFFLSMVSGQRLMCSPPAPSLMGKSKYAIRHKRIANFLCRPNPTPGLASHRGCWGSSTTLTRRPWSTHWGCYFHRGMRCLWKAGICCHGTCGCTMCRVRSVLWRVQCVVCRASCALHCGHCTLRHELGTLHSPLH